jgi:hypothetical protein
MGGSFAFGAATAPIGVWCSGLRLTKDGLRDEGWGLMGYGGYHEFRRDE